MELLKKVNAELQTDLEKIKKENETIIKTNATLIDENKKLNKLKTEYEYKAIRRKYKNMDLERNVKDQKKINWLLSEVILGIIDLSKEENTKKLNITIDEAAKNIYKNKSYYTNIIKTRFNERIKNKFKYFN